MRPTPDPDPDQVLGEDGCAADAEMAYDCLCQVRAQCFRDNQRELVVAKIVHGVVAAMASNRANEGVQIVGAEIFALLAGCDPSLAQSLAPEA